MSISYWIIIDKELLLKNFLEGMLFMRIGSQYSMIICIKLQ
jgi:hypothetical protein